MKTSLNTIYDLLYGTIQVLDKSKITAESEAERDKKYEAAMQKKREGLLKALGAPELSLLEDYVTANTAQDKLFSIVFNETVECENAMAKTDFEAEFRRLNGEYKFFDDYSEVSESFIKAYKVCHYFNLLEGSQVDETAERAYKMCAVFYKKGTNILANVDNFMKTSSTGFQNPLHDTFVFNFPKYKDENGNVNFDLEQWKEGIQNLGIAALSKFSLATDLHKIGIDKLPDTVAEFDAMLSKLSYKNNYKNPEIGLVFGAYRVPEATFDTTLNLIEKGEIKLHGVHDNMPDAFINVGALDSAKNGTYLMKIPKGNPRVLILGHITGCCQSIDGHAKKCVRDAMNLENNTCYALVKVKPGRSPSPTNTASSAALQNSSSSSSSVITSNDKLIDWDTLFEKDGHKMVGQFYAWRSDLGNFCIDSSELSDGLLSNETFKKMMKAFAEEIMKNDPTIERVTIGKGGRTPVGVFPISNYSESMKEGYMYGDAIQQYEIAVSPKLQALRDWLSTKSAKRDQTSIVSIEQGEYILNMDPEQFEALWKDYYTLSLPYFYKNAQEVINSEKYKRLTSGRAVVLYIYKHTTWQELNTLDSTFLKGLLRSWDEVVLILSEDCCTFQDLIALTLNQRDVLLCPKVRAVYRDGYCTFNDLKEFDVEKINALTGYNAIQAWRLGCCTINDLKAFDVEKINALIGDNAVSLYMRGYCTINDLKELDVEKIRAFTRQDASKAWEAGYCTINDLKAFDPEKITALTCKNAIRCYEKGKCKVNDIKHLNTKEILAKVEELAKSAGPSV